MKTLFASALIAFALLFAPGCSTTGTPPTAEAVKFNSLQATWKTTLEVHNVYCKLAVQGKISDKDQAEVNKAWDTFRKSFEFALMMAKNDWNKPTPLDVESAKDTLITFIQSL